MPPMRRPVIAFACVLALFVAAWAGYGVLLVALLTLSHRRASKVARGRVVTRSNPPLQQTGGA